MAAERHVTNRLRDAYRGASKKDRGQILDEVLAATKMGRSTARRMLAGPPLPDPATQIDRPRLRAKRCRWAESDGFGAGDGLGTLTPGDDPGELGGVQCAAGVDTEIDGSQQSDECVDQCGAFGADPEPTVREISPHRQHPPDAPVSKPLE